MEKGQKQQNSIQNLWRYTDYSPRFATPILLRNPPILWEHSSLGDAARNMLWRPESKLPHFFYEVICGLNTLRLEVHCQRGDHGRD